MTQELLSGLNGYDIPCRHTIQGGESMVCLITHGFGSSKDSPTAQLLAGELMDTQVEIDVLQAALGPELLPKEGTK